MVLSATFWPLRCIKACMTAVFILRQIVWPSGLRCHYKVDEVSLKMAECVEKAERAPASDEEAEKKQAELNKRVGELEEEFAQALMQESTSREADIKALRVTELKEMRNILAELSVKVTEVGVEACQSSVEDTEER